MELWNSDASVDQAIARLKTAQAALAKRIEARRLAEAKAKFAERQSVLIPNREARR
jgi:hypothetical protein